MYIPDKISFRLDFRSKELLAKYLEKKLNRTASYVVRAALRRFLEQELNAMAMEQLPPASDDRPLGDKFAKSPKFGGKK